MCCEPFRKGQDMKSYDMNSWSVTVTKKHNEEVMNMNGFSVLVGGLDMRGRDGGHLCNNVTLLLSSPVQPLVQVVEFWARLSPNSKRGETTSAQTQETFRSM